MTSFAKIVPKHLTIAFGKMYNTRVSKYMEVMRMKCPYCNEFRGNSKVRGYPVKEQLYRHIEVKHQDKLNQRRLEK